MNEVWLIRNEKGLFSLGGTNPGWSEVGKRWNTRKALRQHIAAPLQNFGSACSAKNKIEYYKNCDIVCFEMVVKEVINVKDLYKERL